LRTWTTTSNMTVASVSVQDMPIRSKCIQQLPAHLSKARQSATSPGSLSTS
jgi:hypothetical protein